MEKIELEGDLLDRGKYALSLYRIIGEYDVDHPMEKPTDNDALIMSVSAQWGFGKTTFVQLLKEALQKKNIKSGFDLFPEEMKLNKDDITIYNAWENDYSDDPLDSMFKELMIAITLAQTKEEDRNKYEEYTQRLWEALQNTGNIPEEKPEKNPTMRHLEEGAKYFTAAKREKIRLWKTRQLIEEQIHKTAHKKIVFIIDELDRCKPTYAVKTLEIVKHLFNVKGIVFIFALDIKALQHCVRTVYGNEFEAIGYLQRFFDYSTYMPEVSHRRLVEKILLGFKIVSSSETEAIDEYYRICTNFHLSMREIRTICFAFSFLQKYELKEYPSQARQLYFFLLVIKHKKPLQVDEILYGRRNAERIRELFNEYLPHFLHETEERQGQFMEAMTSDLQIDNMGYQKIFEDGHAESNYHFYNRETAKFDFYGFDFTGYPKNDLPDYSLIRINNDSIEKKMLEQGESLSYVLYRPDLAIIEDVGKMRIIDYVFSKVEQYGSSMSSLAMDRTVMKISKYMKFGRYPQTANGEEEPIEWIVLERKGSSLLLISKYGLDCKPYNEVRKEITWEQCTLRLWLNRDFLQKAFDENERKKIAMKHIKAERNPSYPDVNVGKDTQDKVFLLSIQEAEEYFSSNEERQCIATEYAKKHGVQVDNGGLCWWLRSPGGDPGLAALVSSDGSLYPGGYGVYYDFVALRPALWINL